MPRESWIMGKNVALKYMQIPYKNEAVKFFLMFNSFRNLPRRDDNIYGEFGRKSIKSGATIDDLQGVLFLYSYTSFGAFFHSISLLQ